MKTTYESLMLVADSNLWNFCIRSLDVFDLALKFYREAYEENNKKKIIALSNFLIHFYFLLYYKENYLCNIEDLTFDTDILEQRVKSHDGSQIGKDIEKKLTDAFHNRKVKKDSLTYFNNLFHTSIKPSPNASRHRFFNSRIKSLNDLFPKKLRPRTFSDPILSYKPL